MSMCDAIPAGERERAVPVALIDDAERARKRLAFVCSVLAFSDAELDGSAMSGLCYVLGDVLQAFDGLLASL